MEDSGTDIGNAKQTILSIIKEIYIIVWAQRDNKCFGDRINKQWQQALSLVKGGVKFSGWGLLQIGALGVESKKS